MSSEIEIFHLIDAPAIQGLTFRRFQGEKDYPKMIGVLQDCKETDQLDEVDSLEVLAASYAHLNNCDPYQDMLFVEVDGSLAGFSRVFWEDASHTGRLYCHEGYVLPSWRNKGIGGALLSFNEHRLIKIAESHPNTSPRFFQAEAFNTETDKIRLLEKEGYAPVRYFSEMVRSNLENLPNYSLPPGLEIRPVQSEHYRTIWETNNEAMSDHWDHVDYSEEDYLFWLQGDEEFQPDLWKVAWDTETNQVAGMVLGFINQTQNAKFNRKRGWPEDICVRRQWRKRGVAHALIAETLREFKSRGMDEAAMYADTENLSGAFQLYRDMGFSPHKTRIVYQKQIDNQRSQD